MKRVVTFVCSLWPQISDAAFLIILKHYVLRNPSKRRIYNLKVKIECLD